MIGTALAIGAGGCGAATAYWALPWALRRRAVHGLRQLCGTRRLLVLTYDDGPGERTTPAVLDLLAAHSAKATFFLLGKRAQTAPGIVERTVAEGHEIGSHGFAHLNAWKTSPGAWWQDIRSGDASLASWGDENMIFRPPHGKLTLDGLLRLKRRQRPVGWWTVDSGDTWTPMPDPERIRDRVVEAGGGVVLLHDFDRRSEREEHTLRVTELLLEAASRYDLCVETLGNVLADRSSRGDDGVPATPRVSQQESPGSP